MAPFNFLEFFFTNIIPVLITAGGAAISAAALPEGQQLQGFPRRDILAAFNAAQQAAQSQLGAAQEFAGRDITIPGADVSGIVGDINIEGLDPDLGLGISRGTADIIGQSQTFPGIKFPTSSVAGGGIGIGGGGGGGAAAFSGGPASAFTFREEFDRFTKNLGPQAPDITVGLNRPALEPLGPEQSSGDNERGTGVGGQDPQDVLDRVNERLGPGKTDNLLARFSTQDERDEALDDISLILRLIETGARTTQV